MRIISKTKLPLSLIVACATFNLSVGCNKSNFQGSTGAQKAGATPPAKPKADEFPLGKTNAGYNDDKAGPLEKGDAGSRGSPAGTTDNNGNTPILTFDNGFAGLYAINPIKPLQRNHIWGVTTNGSVTYLQYANNAIANLKQWSGALGAPGGAQGSRTYVLEGGGAVISRIGGYLYFVDPNTTKAGDIKANGGRSFYKLEGPAASDRVCVVSYRRDGKRFLGMGWGIGNFSEVPQDNTAPFAPQWENMKVMAGNAGPGQWGYSCYVDQNRLIYYSQWALQQNNGATPGTIQALDLKTMKAVTATAVAPNGNFKSANLTDETMGAQAVADKGSYALAGDPNGNVLNGNGYYTFGYEPVTNTVWGNGRGGGSPLHVFPASCFASKATCTGFAAFNPQQIGFQVGPISALGDGNMVGMVRGSGDVILMKLNDPSDVTKGVTATKIHNLGGDPYMYTDFTGATLYITESEQSFNLGAVAGYNTAKPFRGLGFTWAPRDVAKLTWSDIRFEIRCYKATADKPEYVQVEAPVKDALQQTILTSVPQCTGKSFDTVDIRMTQINNGDSLMNVRKLQVTGYQ
jgi:hypothetical protein